MFAKYNYEQSLTDDVFHTVEALHRASCNCAAQLLAGRETMAWLRQCKGTTAQTNTTLAEQEQDVPVRRAERP